MTCTKPFAIIAGIALRTLGAAAAMLSIGCASTAEQRPDMAWDPVMPQAAPAASSAGSIYRNGQGLALFADQKARSVGDVITIVLVERTNARTSASTTTSNDSQFTMENPTLFGRQPSIGGVPALDFNLGSEREFAGKGDSAQSNRLEGSVTATVVARLANGNLMVRGQKRLSLNRGDELVRVQGIVRPADIGPDNSIPSSRIAEAEIVYSGRGVLADANAKGWFTRFFDWVKPF